MAFCLSKYLCAKFAIMIEGKLFALVLCGVYY